LLDPASWKESSISCKTSCLEESKNFAALLGAVLPGDLVRAEFGDWEIRIVATPSQGFEV